MKRSDLGWLLLLVVVLSSFRRSASSSTAPASRSLPNPHDMSPEDQAERLPGDD